MLNIYIYLLLKKMNPHTFCFFTLFINNNELQYANQHAYRGQSVVRELCYTSSRSSQCSTTGVAMAAVSTPCLCSDAYKRFLAANRNSSLDVATAGFLFRYSSIRNQCPTP